jgi:cellulose synthase/poly-beta-1,6-N-acetylglucosamine synthase-like glycosyltransferase
VTAVATIAGTTLAPFNAYLVALLGAAAWGRRGAEAAGDSTGGLRFAVIVPARDEEDSVEHTLASLARLEYPRERVERIVIADNCSDRTAAVAGSAGATVWVREGGEAGGKGAALAWGLERLAAERPEVDAVVVVDADCTVAANLLSAVEARLGAGASAVQVAYEVANAEASFASGLRYASFALINFVRPLGKTALGLSSGLFGTGMAFSSALLSRRPWTARSLLEDQEYHLQLVAAGERVQFAGEAWVRSAMPTSLRSSSSQQLRWDAGRAQLIRTWTPHLLARGLRSRDAVRVHAALEPLVPPQSLLLAANILSAGLALRGSRRARRVAFVNLAGQIGFVAGGLALARAPAAVWRALAFAPALALWKLALLGRLWVGRGPTSWVRTERYPGQRLACTPGPPAARRAIRRSWSRRT